MIQEMVQEYIDELESLLDDSNQLKTKEQKIADKIMEILEVYRNDIPNLEDSLALTSGTINRDARILKNKLKQYLLTLNNNKNSDEKDSIEPLIFLSHSSIDKKYGDILEKFIVGLGVKDDHLIYTSHPKHKIPLDEKIFDYLRKHIYSNIFMIILWSDKYLESPVCMNELGAGWVTGCDYTNIFTPDFSLENEKYKQCVVDDDKMGIILNGDETCKEGIFELADKILKRFDIEMQDSEKEQLIEEIIKEIKDEQTKNAYADLPKV